MMPASKQETALVRFLLANLGIIIVFIMTLGVILSAYPSVFAPTPTLTSTITRVPTQTASITPSPTNSLTPTVTRTRRATFTPTITLTPTRTMTPGLSPTPPGPPTLTPARPVVSSASYKLYVWDITRQAQVLALLEDYPNTLTRQARGENDANYYAAYYYPALAYAEAVLRFPDAPEAAGWRWQRAFALARQGDASAGEAYAEILAAALNRDEVRLADLPAWFATREPRLALALTEITPPPGSLSAHLLEIQGRGSAFILLLETPGAYSTHVLASRLDFLRNTAYGMLHTDFTGDGMDEVAIYPVEPLTAANLELPQVFDLAVDPPQELEFDPVDPSFTVGLEYTNRWAPGTGSNGKPTLTFQADLFDACPIHIERRYTWTGKVFAVESTLYQLSPIQATLAYCQMAVDLAATAWGAPVATSFSRQLLPLWPPTVQTDGQPYPADALDEWRFRIATYQVMAGDESAGRATLDELIASPRQPNGAWAQAAGQFQAAYKSPADAYRACLLSSFCQPREVVAGIVNGLPAGTADIQARLTEAGAAVRTSGYFDFDGDGARESWFTLRHRPAEKLEFWIVARSQAGTRAFYIDSIDTNIPELSYYQEEPLPPIVLLQNKLAFQLLYSPDDHTPYIVHPTLPRFYPDRFRLGMQAARDALLSGGDPDEARQQLLDLQENPGLLCKAFYTCDEYYYYLGLASELAGKTNEAIEAYLRVWWDNSRSPFTVMVRLRLKGAAVLPSATPTPTTTGTLLPSATPTITGTPYTPTPTPTPTTTGTPNTATPTVTVTLTPEGYPFATNTTSP